jgi:hypothetical protein
MRTERSSLTAAYSRRHWLSVQRAVWACKLAPMKATRRMLQVRSMDSMGHTPVRSWSRAVSGSAGSFVVLNDVYSLGSPLTSCR